MSTPLVRLGRGVVWMSLVDSRTNRALGWYPVLSTTAFSISATVEKLPHYNYSTKGRPKDASLLTAKDYVNNFTVDDINPQMMAMFFGADGSETVTQSAATAIAISISNPLPGMTYFLGETATSVMGDKNVSNVVITAGPTALVEDTDYTVDLVNGSISFLEGGAVTSSTASVTGTYDRAAASFSRFISSDKEILVSIRFITDNNTNDPDNPEANEVWKLPRVSLAPDGSFDLLGDEWQSMTFSGEVLKFGTLAEVYRDGKPFV